jgi:DNA-binding MarR family transcriptional regulator
MSSKSGAAEPPLTGAQQETWLAYMRVMLRLNYEMNRQLQVDSELSLADYDVLNALADVPARRMQLSTLAARIGWERSRVSHHVQRMSRRALVELAPSATDRRATDAVLSAAGRAALEEATPGHATLVRRMFFDGLDPELVPALHRALIQIHEQVLAAGTLPRPAEQRRLPGLYHQPADSIPPERAGPDSTQ